MMPGRYREPVNSLLNDLMPDVDVSALYVLLEHYEALAQRISDCLVPLEAGVRAVNDGIAGDTAVTSGAAGASLGRDLELAGDKTRAAAKIIRAYADAVAQTQQRLAVVAAIADRELLAGEVLAVATGDTTAQAGAQDLAARTMSAAAGELDRRTAEITKDSTEASGPANDHQPGGMPMTPGAMMAPMAGALAGIAAGRAAAGAGDPPLPDADLGMLRARAAVLTATQPPEVAPWLRVAVGLGADANGRRTVIIGTSEPAGYLRPGVVPEPHEVVVGDGRAPELAILGYLRERDLTPLAVCAGTPPPPDVAAAVGESGAFVVVPDRDDDLAESGQ